MVEPKNNLNVLGVLYYVWGGISIALQIGIYLFMIIGVGIVSRIYMFDFSNIWINIATFFLFFILLINILVPVLNILCGYYLMRRKYRTFCFVISILTCLNIPFGTILGIFTLVELEKPEVRKLFEIKSV